MASCSSGDDGDDDGPDSADVARLADHVADAHDGATEVDVVLDRLARQCLDDQGFTIHPDPQALGGSTPMPFQSSDITISMGVRYMHWEEAVPQVGYGRAPHEMVGDGAIAPTLDGSDFDRLTPDEQADYWEALFGFSSEDLDDQAEPLNEGDDQLMVPGHEVFTLPDGTRLQYPLEGCEAEAEELLLDGGRREFRELEHHVRAGMARATIGELADDAEVRSAEQEWSTCMERAGHSGLQTPDDARNRASSSYGTAEVFGPDDPGYDELKAQEIELATADHACNHETGLDELRVEVYWRLVAEVFTDREPELVAWGELVEAALTRGQGLLGEGE